MPTKGSRLAFTASQVAVTARRRDHAAHLDARREHAAAKLEQYIEQVVASAPPLTVEQRDRLAALLRTAEPAAKVLRRPTTVTEQIASGGDFE
ncbi:hypothetical protein QSU92_01220 [Microbacterium sp. ET2]|uniref:hypothetical protein n=1 Tax=Microbacterium albipurpureum TaxID=3050384 RepID=UPI00259C8B6A|nr:hypothetical protein [Microbacterium sp. ET2 (Ac-2212)]WJL95876.1 hypothetical protein QSU92_01220 [Microbacterium sp. ET2 (Ac-2212)]